MAVIHPSSPHYRWYVVGLLTLIACLNYGDRAALSSVLPLIRDDLKLSPVLLGAVGSAFLWVYAICSPASGYLADRWPRSKVVVWTLTAWSLVMALTALAQNAQQLVVARGLLGLAECAYVPAAIGLTAEYHPGPTRARAMGIQLAGYNLGVVFGGVFSGYMGDHFGWRPAFWVLGLAGLAVAMLAQATLAKSAVSPITATEPKTRPSDAIRTLFSTPTFVIVLLESTCIASGVWMFLVWLPLYFRETFGLSLSAAGLAGTVGLQAAATSASLVGGVLSDGFAKSRRERRMLFQCICFCVAIPFLSIFAGNPSLLAASVAIFLFSFFRSLASTSDVVLLCDVLPSRVWSTSIGITNAANCAAGASAVLAAGYLKEDFGLGAIFMGLWVTAAAAACLTMLGYRRYLRRDLERARERRSTEPVVDASSMSRQPATAALPSSPLPASDWPPAQADTKFRS